MVAVICGQLFSCQYAQVVSLTSQTQSLPSLICRAQGSPCRFTPTPALTSTTRLSEACRVWDLWWPFRLESRQSVVQPELQSPQSTAWPPTAHLQERTKFQDSSHSANSKRPREAVLEVSCGRLEVSCGRYQETSEVKSLPIVMLEPSFPEGLVILGSRQHNVKPPGWWGSFRRKTEVGASDHQPWTSERGLGIKSRSQLVKEGGKNTGKRKTLKCRGTQNICNTQDLTSCKVTQCRDRLDLWSEGKLPSILRLGTKGQYQCMFKKDPSGFSAHRVQR